MKPLLLLQVLKSIISKDIFKPFTKIIIHKQMTIIVGGPPSTFQPQTV